MTSDEIKALRDAYGESRPAFAARLNVSVFSVYRWEHGNYGPDARSVLKLQALQRALERKKKKEAEA